MMSERLDVIADETQSGVDAAQFESGKAAGVDAVTYKDLEDATASINSEVGEVGAAIDDELKVLNESMQENVKAVNALGDTLSRSDSEDAQSGVVLIDDAQWQEMRDSWLWAKSCAQVGLFLALVVVLSMAALLGTRLWTTLARGWRTS